MKGTCIFDASSIARACIEGEAYLLRGASTISLALYESLNAVLALVRRGVLDEKAGNTIIAYMSRVLGEVKIVDIDPDEFAEVFSLARNLDLAIHDAAYLYVAKKLGLDLVTENPELREKASRCGVKTVSLDELLKPITPTQT